MLNELEVTVEGEDTGGKEGEGLALGFPAKALLFGAWGQALPAAVVVRGLVEEEETGEEDMAADVVGGVLLMG